MPELLEAPHDAVNAESGKTIQDGLSARAGALKAIEQARQNLASGTARKGDARGVVETDWDASHQSHLPQSASER